MGWNHQLAWNWDVFFEDPKKCGISDHWFGRYEFTFTSNSGSYHLVFHWTALGPLQRDPNGGSTGIRSCWIIIEGRWVWIMSYYLYPMILEEGFGDLYGNMYFPFLNGELILEPPGSSKSQEGSFAQLFFCGWETRVAQLAQPHPLSWHLTPFPFSNVQAVTSHNGNYSVSCAEHGDFYNTFQVCKGCWKACREGKHPKRKKTWVEDRDIYAKQPKTVGPYLDLSQMIVMSFNFP